MRYDASSLINIRTNLRVSIMLCVQLQRMSNVTSENSYLILQNNYDFFFVSKIFLSDVLTCYYDWQECCKNAAEQ